MTSHRTSKILEDNGLISLQKEAKKILEDLDQCKNELKEYEQLTLQQQQQYASMEEQHSDTVANLNEQISGLQDEIKDKEQKYCYSCFFLSLCNS